jgi:penicillin-binding protein 2
MPDRDWKRRNYGESWSTGDTYNAAFGQGYVTVTPLQLISAVATIANGGTLYQPTVIKNFLDAEGNVIQPFAPQIMRTVNIDNDAPNDTLTLFMVEDMIMKGPNSLACVCEVNSGYYNPLRCDPQNYRSTVDINPDPYIEDLRTYRVEVPMGYTFNNICQPVRWNEQYTPAFVSGANLTLIRQGMREAVVGAGGTAPKANLPYVHVAGKTGTAEYCDNVARPLGLCIPGQWPEHAWFVAFAPYEKPEVVIIAFIYNGGEGSANALPVVVQTMEDYYRLKNERAAVAAGQPTTLIATPAVTRP